MRSHRRRHPIPHVLVAGVWEDLPAIRRVLQTLPADSYGQVFVEAPADADLAGLPAPERVTVTCLAADHGADSSHTDVLTARGALLAEAVTGWFAEWMPDEPQPEREFAVWVGGATSDHLEAVCAFEPLIERL